MVNIKKDKGGGGDRPTSTSADTSSKKIINLIQQQNSKIFDISKYDRLIQSASNLNRKMVTSGNHAETVKFIEDLFKGAEGYFDKGLLKTSSDFFKKISKLLHVLRPISEDKCVPNVKFVQFPELITILEKLKPSEAYDFQGVKFLLIFSLMDLFWKVMQYIFKSRKTKMNPFTSSEYDWVSDGINQLSEMFQEYISIEEFKDRKQYDVNAYFLQIKFKLFTEYLSSQKPRPDDDWFVKNIDDCCQILERCEELYEKTNNPVEFLKRTTYSLSQILTPLNKLALPFLTNKFFKTTTQFISTMLEEDLERSISNADVSVSIILLCSECFFNIGDLDGGLKWISKWLLRMPIFLSNPAQHFDYFEPIGWYDISHQWTRLKRQAQKLKLHSLEKKTIRDFLNEIEDGESLMEMENETIIQLLKFELNSYFSCKTVLYSSLLSVGQALEAYGRGVDEVLGIILQAASLWWHDDESKLIEAYTLCETAIERLSHPKLERTSERGLGLFLAFSWLGLVKLRIIQMRASQQLEYIRDRDKQNEPDKHKKYGTDEEVVVVVEEQNSGLQTVPAITNIKLTTEVEIVGHLSSAIDILYILSGQEETEYFKKTVNHGSSAFVQMTIRMVASIISSFGDILSTIKAWHICYVISKMYDRKYLSLVSGCELIKLLPKIDKEIVQHLENVKAYVLSKAIVVNTTRGYLLKFDLAKSIGCLREEKFEEGIEHLKNVLEYRFEADNLDTSIILISEAFYVLSLYKDQQSSQSHHFSFDKIGAETGNELYDISAAALALKGFKNLQGMARKVSPEENGWSDIIHNFNLISLTFQMGSYLIEQYKKLGKIKDLKNVCSSMLFLSQTSGIVSRSIQFLHPLAEIDIECRHFDACQNKLHAVEVILADFTQGKRNTMILKNIYNNVIEDKDNKKTHSHSEMKTILQNIESDEPFSWRLSTVTLPEHNYMNNGGRTESKKECSPYFGSLNFGLFSCFLHHINCNCYLCRHTYLPYAIIKIYALQTRFALFDLNPHLSRMIMKRAKIYLQKCLARITSNLNYHRRYLGAISNPESIDEFLRITFLTPFFSSAMTILTTEMEITPTENITKITSIFNDINSFSSYTDPQKVFLQSLSFEIFFSALFHEIFIKNRHLQIKNTNLRQQLNEACEKYFPVDEDSKKSPKEYGIDQIDEQLAHLALTAPKKDLKRIGRKVPYSPFSPVKLPVDVLHFPNAEDLEFKENQSKKFSKILDFTSSPEISEAEDESNSNSNSNDNDNKPRTKK